MEQNEFPQSPKILTESDVIDIINSQLFNLNKGVLGGGRLLNVLSNISDNTVSSAVTTFTTPTFAQKERLDIFIYAKHGATNNGFSLRFNGDSGANYNYHDYSNATQQQNTFGGSSIAFGNSATSDDYFLHIRIINMASIAKGGTYQYAEWTGVGAAPDDGHGTFVWNNTTDQITSVTLIASQASGVAATSRIIIYGA